MAEEDELASLTEKLDGIMSEVAEGGDGRPDEMLSSAEKFRVALAEGTDQIKDAVSNLEGGDATSEVKGDISKQVGQILPNEDSVSTQEIIAQEIAFEEGFDPKQIVSEETTQKVQETMETEAAEIGEGFAQTEQDLKQIKAVFEALGESSKVSREELQAVSESFGSFQEDIYSTISAIEEGETTMQEAADEVGNITESAKEDLSQAIEENIANVEGVAPKLEQIMGDFSANIQAEMGGGGSFASSFAQVGGAVSEIGGGGLSLFQTISDRASGIAETLTKSTEEAAINLEEAFTSPVPVSEISEGPLKEVNSELGLVQKKFSNVLSNISMTKVAIAGLLIPIAAAADLLEDAFGVARDFREETGVGAERMRELRNLTAQTSEELAGFGLKPDATLDIVSGLREGFGSLETAVARTGQSQQELVTQTGALSKGFALSASEAAQLQATLTELESVTGISRENLTVTTRELARQNEVAPQQAMQQISENSEELAKFAGSSSERLAEAAVEAQRLGVGLDKVTSFQEQALTDVTGTVEQLQKASMLTGQQFDSTALIQASFKGTEATLSEITNQLEGIDVEAMNPFQKMSLADSFGMSVEEIQRISEGQEALKGLNTTAEKAQAIASGELSFEQAMAEGASSNVQSLTQSFNALYFTMAEELFPVLEDFIDSVIPAVETAINILTPLAKGLASGVRLLADAFSLLDFRMDDFGTTVSEVFAPFRNIATFIGGTEEQVNEMEDSISLLNETLKATGTILAGGFGLKLLSDSLGGLIGKLPEVTGSLNLFSTEVESFTQKGRESFSNLRETITNFTSDKFDTFRNKASKAFGFIQNKFDSAFGFIQNKFDSLKNKANKAFGFIQNKFDSLKNSASGAFGKMQGGIMNTIPSFDQFRNAVTRAGRASLRFARMIPGMIVTAAGTIITSMKSAALATYGFVASLNATGIGAIVIGLSVAIGALAASFKETKGPMAFITNALNTFTEQVFGVKNITEKLTETVLNFGSKASEALHAIGLGFVADSIGFVADKVYELVSGFYEGMTAGEAFGATVAIPFQTIKDLIFDTIGAFKSLLDFITLIGYSIKNLLGGETEKAKEQFFNSFIGIGKALLDLVIPGPDAVEGAMYDFASWIRGFLPFSPAKRGPLSDLGAVGSAFVDTIFGGGTFSYVSSKASQFASHAMDSMKAGLDSAQEMFYEAIDFGGALISKFQSIEGSIQDKLEGVGRMVLNKVLPDGANIDAAMEHFREALDIYDYMQPFDEMYSYVTRLIGGIQELGSAIVGGNFGQIDDILWDMVGDLGYNLIDMFLPDDLSEYAAEKMSGVFGTVREFLPFSPAERGPLIDLDVVGSSLINTIFSGDINELISEKMSGVGSIIVSRFSEAFSESKEIIFDLGDALMKNLVETIQDGIDYVSEIVDLFYDLGEAVMEGNFTDIGGIMLDGVEGISASFIDLMVPDSLQQVMMEELQGVSRAMLETVIPDDANVDAAMRVFTETIRGFLPFSPAKEGPLSDLDVVGTAFVDTIFDTETFGFADEKMQQLGQTIMSTIESFGSVLTNIFGIGDQEISVPTPNVSEMTVQTATINAEKAVITGMDQPAATEANQEITRNEELVEHVKNVSEAAVSISEQSEQASVKNARSQFDVENTQNVQSVEENSNVFVETFQTEQFETINENLSEEISSAFTSTEVDNTTINTTQISDELQSVISETQITDAVSETETINTDISEVQRQIHEFAQTQLQTIETPSINVNPSDNNVLVDIPEGQEMSFVGDQSVTVNLPNIETEEITETTTETRTDQTFQETPTEAPQVNVQPAQTDVATVSEEVVRSETQTTETEPVTAEFTDTTIEDLLQKILNSHRQLLTELRKGNIAVYLDGRKVNNELLRKPGF